MMLMFVQLLKEFSRIKGKDVIANGEKRWKEVEGALLCVLKKNNFNKVMTRELEPLGNLEELDSYSGK